MTLAARGSGSERTGGTGDGEAAVFLDRDGTLVHPRHYPSRPEQLVLFDGVGPELRELQVAGFRLIVITNQSGIARGVFSEDDLTIMHEYLLAELAGFGVHIDGVYYCPHHPEGVVPELAVRCDCRKPRPGMLTRAAHDLGLDLARSWFVGDILDDVEAGNRAGCRTVLVDLGTESTPEVDARQPTFVAWSTVHALRLIQAIERVGLAEPEPELLSYVPPRWRHAYRQPVLAAPGGIDAHTR